VTILVDEIFKGCSMLQFVNFPPDSKVAILGDSVFASCTSLQTIVLPGSLSILGESTFQGCTSLQDVTFPPNLIVCGPHTFKDGFRITALTMNLDLWSSVASSLEPHDQGLDQFVYTTTYNYKVDRTTPGPPTLILTAPILTIVVPWHKSYLLYVVVIGGVLLVVVMVFVATAMMKNRNKQKKKNNVGT
jgi:hypothetical protein